jgi:Zn-dependent M28 family amino/carboxypeptidase
MRTFASKNVVAAIRGAGEAEECVVYTAHWDHLGRNGALKGDQIFNGAVDNATGTAALLELAQAYAKLARAPRRSVVFVATTAEEKGLLGSEYHARHPACPLANTAAVMNLDAHFPFGAFDAMTVPGLGSSEVEGMFAKAAARLGRVLQADSEPQAGAYYRSDHYPFAKRGVPAIYAVGTPRDTTTPDPKNPVVARFVDYVTTKYHKVTDEYDAATWDLSGVEGDVKVYFEAGLEIANSAQFPNWLAGSEFRRLRDAMRARQ